MLDIAFVRENPDVVDAACASRQNAHWDRERFFALDEGRRSTIVAVEKLQAERNSLSKRIGELMREGKREEAEAIKAEISSGKGKISELQSRFPTARMILTIRRRGVGALRATSTLRRRPTGISGPISASSTSIAA